MWGIMYEYGYHPYGYAGRFLELPEHYIRNWGSVGTQFRSYSFWLGRDA